MRTNLSFNAGMIKLFKNSTGAFFDVSILLLVSIFHVLQNCAKFFLIYPSMLSVELFFDVEVSSGFRRTVPAFTSAFCLIMFARRCAAIVS